MNDHELARACFQYDPETGILTRVMKCNRWGKLIPCKPKSDWSLNGRGYQQVYLNGRIHRVHRLIFLIMEGRWPEQIDHINGIRTDNRWVNLREVSNQENRMNQKRYVNNSSGICGVRWDKTSNKWRSYIRVNTKEVHLGLFEDFFEACCARKSAEVRYGFHRNHGRVGYVGQR